MNTNEVKLPTEEALRRRLSELAGEMNTLRSVLRIVRKRAKADRPPRAPNPLR